MQKRALGWEVVFRCSFLFFFGMTVLLGGSGVDAVGNNGSYRLELSYTDLRASGTSVTKDLGGSLKARSCAAIWAEIMTDLGADIAAELDSYDPASTEDATITIKGAVILGHRVRPFEITAYYDYVGRTWVPTYVTCP